MSEQQYPWKRFWCDREDRFDLDQSGYLGDPEEEFAFTYRKNVHTLEQIGEKPCLVLLGEPGIGKSTELRAEYRRIHDISDTSKNVFLFKDLNQYGDEDRLIREIFESEIVRKWKNEDSTLHLFLDSLDECRLQLNHIAKILQAQLLSLKNFSSQLRLKIVCRTAKWPSSLENTFAQLWGTEVGFFELVPLRQKDVAAIARANQIDDHAFLNAVEAKEAQPLAMKPLTLQMLLNLYSKHQQLPNGQDEIYQKGCELLSAESNPERRDSDQVGSLSTDRRIALASRIAAVTVFCNRSSISLDVDAVNLSESDLRLSELTGGKERVGGDTFEFTENDLREVCNSGLFTGSSKGRVGFSHQAFADFLAARYILTHGLRVQQIKSLIQLSQDPDGMVVPQLRGTARWLNEMNSELFLDTIRRDPQVLLSADLFNIENKHKYELVESLLHLFEQLKIFDSDFGLRAQYSALSHPTLATQLKPFISDKKKHFLVRRVAIDIAEACKLGELQELLANIALDRTDAHNIRVQAAHAIAEIGDLNARLKLKPLAIAPQDDDSNDELKGCTLRGLWPGLITTNELFNCLTPPKNENLLGSYAFFLVYIVPEHLSIQDLPFALAWITYQPPSTGLWSHIESLNEHILFKAWQYLAEDCILEAFAEAAVPRLRNYLSICPIPRFGTAKKDERPALPDPVRRKLIIRLVSKLGQSKDDAFIIAHPEPPLLTPHDLSWMVRNLINERDERLKSIWVTLIELYFDRENQNHFESVYYSMNECEILAQRFRLRFGPIELRSEEARRMKADYERFKNLEDERRRREEERNRPISHSPGERIRNCLNRFEEGDSDGWWRLCLEMTLDSGSKVYIDELQSDLQSLPGWINSDQGTRNRIIQAGKKYILESDAAPSKWLGTQTLHRPAAAGYKALILLQKVDPVFVDSLSPKIWANWAPVLLGHPESSGFVGQDETYMDLICKAFRYAPEEILSTLRILIDQENEKSGSLFILRKMEKCWNQRLCASLLEKCEDEHLKPNCLGILLSELIAHNDMAAEEYAKSLLTLPLPVEGDDRARSIAAALALLAKAKDAGWDKVWTAVRAEREFGHEVFLALPRNMEERRSMSLAVRIGEENTAELFVWLMEEFPPEKYSQPAGVHWVGPREAIANYRDGLIEHLKIMGTTAAIRAIERIKARLPDLEYLNFVLVTARRNVRMKNWTPLRPKEFIQLAQSPSSRVVLNSDDLINAVTESLLRLQKKLHGETPDCIFLWDRVPASEKQRPKLENDLSDYIKNHLQEDLLRSGIIAAREIEIRRRQSGDGEPGERTDIYIACFVPSSGKHARVIIEVKGCWNPNIKTAMKDQLLNRYLRDKDCQHGIYLVGWFDCPHWDAKDTRKKGQTLRMSFNEAGEYFDKMATELSCDERIIKSFLLDCTIR